MQPLVYSGHSGQTPGHTSRWESQLCLLWNLASVGTCSMGLISPVSWGCNVGAWPAKQLFSHRWRASLLWRKTFPLHHALRQLLLGKEAQRC